MVFNTFKKNYFEMKDFLTQFIFSLILVAFWGVNPAFAQPSNDICANATTLVCGAGAIAGTTVDAVPPDDPLGCASDYGVWYTFAGDGSEVTLSSTTTFDHELDIFTTSAGCGSINDPIVCRDGSIGTEVYTFTTVNSTTYYVYVAHSNEASTATGTFTIELTCAAPTPGNDVCSGAVDYDTTFGAIGASGTCPTNTETLDISNYEDNGIDPTCDGGSDATAWYTWTANATSITFTSGSGRPGIEVLDGSCGSFTSMGCINNTSGIIDNLTIGNSYYILIWDDTTTGSTIEWCLEATPPPPANDACADAITITSGVILSGSTLSANDIEGASPCSSINGTGTLCGSGNGDGTIDWNEGVWYVYTSTGFEDIVVDLGGSNFDTEVQVFSGSCGSLTCIGGDDDSSPAGGDNAMICFVSSASFAPVDYYIYVDGHSGNTGDYFIEVNATPLPVELISFKGEKMEDGNKLTWVTGSEINTQTHFVERSLDGNRWEPIGAREAQGYATSERFYELMDEKPFAKSFYRLKSIDFDGAIHLSKVIQLQREIGGFSIAEVFPIPAKDELTIAYNVDRNEEVSIIIADFAGRVVYEEKVLSDDGINNHQLDVANLASGIYFVRLSNASEHLTHRIIKN